MTDQEQVAYEVSCKKQSAAMRIGGERRRQGSELMLVFSFSFTPHPVTHTGRVTGMRSRWSRTLSDFDCRYPQIPVEKKGKKKGKRKGTFSHVPKEYLRILSSIINANVTISTRLNRIGCLLSFGFRFHLFPARL